MKIEYFGLSHIGRVRKANQDLWAALPEEGLFVVADGMGGHPAGDLAARLAVDAVCASADAGPHTAVAAANRAVREQAEGDLRGMGTTLCVVHIRGDLVSYAHVGDSRIYRRIDGTTEQLTDDHSVWVPTPEGNLVRKLTQAIGTAPELQPGTGSFRLGSSDRLLLCSDGLTDVVDQEVIDEILCRDDSLKEIGEELVAAAMAAGAPDNVTVLLVETSDG